MSHGAEQISRGGLDAGRLLDGGPPYRRKPSVLQDLCEYRYRDSKLTEGDSE
jgi:hypothetical protein